MPAPVAPVDPPPIDHSVRVVPDTVASAEIWAWLAAHDYDRDTAGAPCNVLCYASADTPRVRGAARSMTLLSAVRNDAAEPWA